ncbi:MAG: patatin-like phospholipase family protein [Candidatus Azambacteria bacterium]|nr:patatin-like phospholipase family protein [Candidatus Azambacteria bacterium]
MATKKIGLALGGGGAKGLAHIGIIKALEAAGIKIDYIAGTSMGALVGGWYATTGDIRALEDFLIHIKRNDIFPIKKIIKHKDGALFKGESIADKLRKELKNIKIEDCKIPFTALATNTKNGDEVRLKSGDLVDAIRASAALPIVFAPVAIDGQLLMDGGLVNPVPADVVKDMGADYIIAVDVSSKWFTAPEELVTTHDIYGVISSALSIIEHQIAKSVLKSANLVLRPPVMSHNWLEFNKAQEIIKVGEKELELNLREIRRKTGYKKPAQTLAEKFLDFILNKPS